MGGDAAVKMSTQKTNQCFWKGVGVAGHCCGTVGKPCVWAFATYMLRCGGQNVCFLMLDVYVPRYTAKHCGTCDGVILPGHQ